MAEVTIKVERSDNLARFPQLFSEEFGAAMTLSTNLVLGDGQRLSPVDRGFFRSSLDISIEEQALQITGRVFATAAHAPVIEGVDKGGNPTEYGRRPGAKFPDVTELRGWVRRVLSISDDKEVSRVAFLVGRAIVRRGIRPVRPLTRALEQNESRILGLFQDAADRIASRLESAE